MKTHKVIPHEKVSRNIDDFDKLESFIKNDLVQSKDDYVCNNDLIDYLKEIGINAYPVDIWNLMRKYGFKRGQRRVSKIVKRGYYAKLKQ